jgi:peptidoglycan hydrolase-like protein with peptidoglycan-binding domain
MTSSTEVNSVLNIIHTYNLTQYDSEEVYREPITNVKAGACGNGVKWIQKQLTKHGYDIEIDGIFGEETEKAVMDFQQKKFVDGIVGSMTRNALKGA